MKYLPFVARINGTIFYVEGDCSVFEKYAARIVPLRFNKIFGQTYSLCEKKTMKIECLGNTTISLNRRAKIPLFGSRGSKAQYSPAALENFKYFLPLEVRLSKMK